jgi:hypothetical protein
MREEKSGTSERATFPRGTGSVPVYQLKVALSGSRPPIWRRLQVPGDVTLGRLHAILQVVMGWKDRHLHLFAAGRTVYRPPLPDLGFPSRDERKVPLHEVLSREKERIRYEYDFRDGWEHTLVVEKILPSGAGSNRPVCLAGKRHAPPEESGGIIAYERLLAARRNSSHGAMADRAEIVNRLGKNFDPEAFDLEAVNRELFRLP